MHQQWREKEKRTREHSQGGEKGRVERGSEMCWAWTKDAGGNEAKKDADEMVIKTKDQER